MKTAQNKLNAFIFNGSKKRLAILVAVLLAGVFAVAGLLAASDNANRPVPEPQASRKSLRLSSSTLPTGPCTEQFVKTGAGVLADDMYFFSAALERPVVGADVLDNASRGISSDRENENYGQLKPDRIVVAPSGDMAYEYGTENIRFDERKSGKHLDFTAAYLRVWKAVDGSCRVAAQMQQPEGQR
jgi:ketosteroid isomerase-like protein